MLHEFKQPIPVIINENTKGWAIYVTRKGNGDEIWAVIRKDGDRRGSVHYLLPTDVEISIPEYEAALDVREPKERNVLQMLGMVPLLEYAIKQRVSNNEPAATVESLQLQVMALREALDDFENAAKGAMDEKCDVYEKHCSCVPILRGKVKTLENQIHYLLNR